MMGSNICGGDATHIYVSMLMEFNPTSAFCHGVTNVLVVRGADWKSSDLLCLTPLQQSKKSDINMTGSFCWCLGIDHEDCAGNVDVGVCWTIWRETQVCQDEAYI